MAKVINLTYDELILHIVNSARGRYRNDPKLKYNENINSAVSY